MSNATITCGQTHQLIQTCHSSSANQQSSWLTHRRARLVHCMLCISIHVQPASPTG